MAKALLKPKEILDPPETVVFAPTNVIFQSVSRTLNQFRKLKSRPPLSGQFNFYQDDNLGLVGPATGSPAAVMALEPLLVSGTKRIISLGTCGRLSPTKNHNSPELFEIIFPSGFISEEGTSKHYPVEGISTKDSVPLVSSESQNRLWQACQNEAHQVRSGLIWTTDAPYRETIEKVDFFHSRGAIAVDMEYAALAKLSLFYQTELVAAFVVSDIVGSKWTNGMGRSELKHKINSLSLISKKVFHL